MKSKLIAVGMAAALAVGSIGLACANPITNGNFSSTSPSHNAPTQFGSRSGSFGGCGAWGGQFVSGWTGNGGYSLWYPSAAAAFTTSAITQYGCASTQRLPAIDPAPTGPGTFIGLDGQKDIQGGISQTINGLAVGDSYTLSFWWGTTQEMSRTGPTWDYLQFSVGSAGDTTPTNNISTHGWSGWSQVFFTFRPSSSSELLSFLSWGGQQGKTFDASAGEPPFAVLTGLSLSHNVPEPPELALFGAGLLGLGLLTVAARRRALRRSGAGGDDNNVA